MLLIEAKWWEQASCPPSTQKWNIKIFGMGHNLPKKYGFNQRTMDLLNRITSRHNILPTTPFAKKKRHMATPPNVLSLKVCCVMSVSCWALWGRKFKAIQRWLLGFMETLCTRVLTSSSESITCLQDACSQQGKGETWVLTKSGNLRKLASSPGAVSGSVRCCVL